MERFPLQILENPTNFFSSLAEIPQPPSKLYFRGNINLDKKVKLLAVVGSRANTSYGSNVCQNLIQGLKGYPIVIISGLALGIDKIAHISAIENNLRTFAFPGSGLEWKNIYPSQHRSLGELILKNNGALISEFEPKTKGAIWTFPQRNRLMAGLADMTLVIEAEEKSGTLITARLATEYNKIVGAVPGSINNPSAKGVNWLLKQGAVPITESEDILKELNIAIKNKNENLEQLGLSDEEIEVLNVLSEPITKEKIITILSLSIEKANVIFSMLEIKGLIRENMGLIEKV